MVAMLTGLRLFWTALSSRVALCSFYSSLCSQHQQKLHLTLCFLCGAQFRVLTSMPTFAEGVPHCVDAAFCTVSQNSFLGASGC